jgi:hypothetical protein
MDSRVSARTEMDIAGGKAEGARLNDVNDPSRHFASPNSRSLSRPRRTPRAAGARDDVLKVKGGGCVPEEEQHVRLVGVLNGSNFP